jgi:hypothetical protein
MLHETAEPGADPRSNLEPATTREIISGAVTKSGRISFGEAIFTKSQNYGHR